MSLESLKNKIGEGNFPIEIDTIRSQSTWKNIEGTTQTSTSLNPNREEALIVYRHSKRSLLAALDDCYETFVSGKNSNLSDKCMLIKMWADKLHEEYELLCQILQLEAGKAKWEAQSDAIEAIDYLNWVSENGSHIIDTILKPAQLSRHATNTKLFPTGVSLAILSPISGPYRFSEILATSILMGNPVVYSATPQSALLTLFLAKCDEDISCPIGNLGFTFSDFDAIRSVLSTKIMSSLICSSSKDSCEDLAKVVHPDCRLALESGGKNAAIVHSSADIEFSTKLIIIGACKSAGQRIHSTGRCFVYRSVLDEFLDTLTKTLKSLEIGPVDSSESDPFMGPLLSKHQVDTFLRFQTMARREPCEAINWGKMIDANQKGYFVHPAIHLFEERVDKQSVYQASVLSSPDLAIYPYDVLQDAFDQCNIPETIQCTSFFGDPSILNERRDMLRAPIVLSNAPTTAAEIIPLAGVSNCGYNPYSGINMGANLGQPQSLWYPPQELTDMWTNIFK